jgi:hypothetical protein
MTSEVPILRMLIRRCRLWLLECSSRLPGFLDIEMDDARDDSWRATFMVWIYLVAKPSHMGVDVDGLGCPLHCPMVHSCQTRGHGLPPGVVLSCRCSRWWRLSGDVKLHRLGYLVES